MTQLPNDQRQQLEALYDEMDPKALTPLWEVLHALVNPEPLVMIVWRQRSEHAAAE